MFLLRPDRDASRGGAEGSSSFTVVLLLDLTALGEVRVDIRLERGELAVDFQVVDLGASLALDAGLGSLRTELEATGLSVRSLLVRQAASLPVADLTSPPIVSTGASLVDFHV